MSVKFLGRAFIPLLQKILYLKDNPLPSLYHKLNLETLACKACPPPLGHGPCQHFLDRGLSRQRYLRFCNQRCYGGSMRLHTCFMLCVCTYKRFAGDRGWLMRVGMTWIRQYYLGVKKWYGCYIKPLRYNVRPPYVLMPRLCAIHPVLQWFPNFLEILEAAVSFIRQCPPPSNCLFNPRCTKPNLSCQIH